MRDLMETNDSVNSSLKMRLDSGRALALAKSTPASSGAMASGLDALPFGSRTFLLMIQNYPAAQGTTFTHACTFKMFQCRSPLFSCRSLQVVDETQ